MGLFPSAATRISLADVWSAIAQAGSSTTLCDFVSDVARRLNMAEGVALTSLMRNTYVIMIAIMKQHPQTAEVILPRYSCPSFIHGIKAAGIGYRYCDLDPVTLTVTPDLIDSVRTSQSTAVLVPNLFGLSADMPALAAYCRAKGMLLIDGADYTFGGVFAGSPLGSFGDFAILNFQEGKALPVGGGMALSRSAGILQLNGHAKKEASSLIAFARTLAYCLLIRPLPYGLFSRGLELLGVQKKRFSMEDTIRATKLEFDFSIDKMELCRRISSYQAALGQRLLASLELQRAQRWANALAIEAALKGLPHLGLVPRHPNLIPCHYIRYPVMVPAARRETLCATLIKEGFEASPMYVEHGMQIDRALFPGAAQVRDELLTLPCHPFVTNKDIKQMCLIVRNHLLA